MPDSVRLLDALCARAWPPLEWEEADGWVHRAANGISLRANSVWPRAVLGAIRVEERIERAEAFYAERGLPARFQLSPAAEPPDLEVTLGRLGYEVHTTTDVMVARGAAAGGTTPVELLALPDDDWRTVLVGSGPDPVETRGRLAIVEAMRLPRRHALVRVDGEAAAIGLGVVDAGWLGIFAMRTLPHLRRRGLARSVVAALLRWAASEGARDAYLQVETDNAAAIALYRGLGFIRLYGYRYCSARGVTSL